jgi:hypothetical protein
MENGLDWTYNIKVAPNAFSNGVVVHPLSIALTN